MNQQSHISGDFLIQRSRPPKTRQSRVQLSERLTKLLRTPRFEVKVPEGTCTAVNEFGQTFYKGRMLDACPRGEGVYDDIVVTMLETNLTEVTMNKDIWLPDAKICLKSLPGKLIKLASDHETYYVRSRSSKSSFSFVLNDISHEGRLIVKNLRFEKFTVVT